MFLSNMGKAEFRAYLKETLISVLKEIDLNEYLKVSINPTQQEYTTAKGTAEFFKITKQTLHNWFAKGTVKKYKVEGRILYKISEIKEKIQNAPYLIRSKSTSYFETPTFKNEKAKEDKYLNTKMKIEKGEQLTEDEKVNYIEFCKKYHVPNFLMP